MMKVTNEVEETENTTKDKNTRIIKELEKHTPKLEKQKKTYYTRYLIKAREKNKSTHQSIQLDK